jgi:hypothetical protein
MPFEIFQCCTGALLLDIIDALHVHSWSARVAAAAAIDKCCGVIARNAGDTLDPSDASTAFVMPSVTDALNIQHMLYSCDASEMKKVSISVHYQYSCALNLPSYPCETPVLYVRSVMNSTGLSNWTRALVSRRRPLLVTTIWRRATVTTARRARTTTVCLAILCAHYYYSTVDKCRTRCRQLHFQTEDLHIILGTFELCSKHLRMLFAEC